MAITVCPAPNQPSLPRERIFRLASDLLGVSPSDIQNPSRGCRDVAFARQVIMYSAHVALGWSYTDAGRLVSRDRTTAQYACALVEDRRDDDYIDKMVQEFEDHLLLLWEFWSAYEALGSRISPSTDTAPLKHTTGARSSRLTTPSGRLLDKLKSTSKV